MQAVDIKTKFYSTKIKAKQNARILAVQCIYTYEIIQYVEQVNINQIILDILSINNYSSSNDELNINKKHFVNIVKQTLTNLGIIDQEISQKLAQDWKIERLPKLVKTIIRVGICELMFKENLDRSVIINEYLEIAKLFEHQGEVGFINTILDKI